MSADGNLLLTKCIALRSQLGFYVYSCLYSECLPLTYFLSAYSVAFKKPLSTIAPEQLVINSETFSTQLPNLTVNLNSCHTALRACLLAHEVVQFALHTTAALH